MLYIQLQYGYVENKKQVQFNLPNNYEESFYFEKAPYLTNPTPAVENKLINLIKNRDDLKKWLLATSDYGHEIQEDLNAVVGYDEKFNNAIVRHALDLKDEAIFRNPNPINVTFYDMKKFDQVNPVIRKLAAQVKASKLTEKEINEKLLRNWEADELQLRLDKLKYGGDDDDNKKPGGGGGSGGTPGPGPPKTPKQEMDEITRRLDRLRGNTPLEVSPFNTKEENSRIIAQKNWQKVLDQRLNRREKELSQLPKGNVKKKRSSIKFKLPETPPVTPQQVNEYWDDVAENWKSTPVPQDLSTPAPLSGPPKEKPSLFDYDRDFPPLSKYVQKRNLPPLVEPSSGETSLETSRETSFLFPESLSPLRNRLPSIAPLPSRPVVDNFSRPITEIANEKNNTISITPKKPVLPPIGQKQLSTELQKIFPDVDKTIQETAETFKERHDDIDELVKKVSSTEDSEITFEFEFFIGGTNSKFDAFVKTFGLTNENIDFVDFLQPDFCKEILLSNDLKIHIETGNIYYQDKDTNESIFEFMENQQNTSKGIIQHILKFDGNYKNYFQ